MADESLEIYNDASGSLEKRTQEQVQKSKYFYDLATKAEIIRWIAWKHFFDNDGHLDFGHTSKKSFILDEFDEAVRTVEKKIQAVEPFAELLPIAEQKLISGDQEASTLTLENDLSDEEKDNLKIINQIGLSKWRLFSRDEHADFSKTISDGVVTFNDGREDVDLDKILSTSFRDWDKKFKEERKKYQRRIANQEEDLKKVEGERDHYKKKLDDNEDLIKRSIEREKMYGPEAKKVEEIEDLLEKSQRHLSKLQHYFSKVEVDEEKHPQALKERVMAIIRSATYIDEMACRRMPWLEDHKLRELTTFAPTRIKDPKLNPDSDEFDPDSEVEGL